MSARKIAHWATMRPTANNRDTATAKVLCGSQPYRTHYRDVGGTIVDRLLEAYIEPLGPESLIDIQVSLLVPLVVDARTG